MQGASELDFLKSHPFWTHLFALTAYVAALACIYAAVAFGRQNGKDAPRKAILSELGIFAFFAVMLWALESWAQFRTPFYVYSPTFLGLVPRLRVFEHSEYLRNTVAHGACPNIVTKLHDAPGYGIPLSVVLLEEIGRDT